MCPPVKFLDSIDVYFRARIKYIYAKAGARVCEYSIFILTHIYKQNLLNISKCD